MSSIALSFGEQLSLIQRTPEWLQVRVASSVISFLQPSALVAPTCITERAEPRILEAPVFAFEKDGPHGNLVIEAELDANTRILLSSLDGRPTDFLDKRLASARHRNYTARLARLCR